MKRDKLSNFGLINYINYLVGTIVTFGLFSCASAIFPLADNDIVYMNKPYEQDLAAFASYAGVSYAKNTSHKNKDVSDAIQLNAHYGYFEKELGGMAMGLYGFLGNYTSKEYDDTKFQYYGFGYRGSFDYNLTPYTPNLNFMFGIDYALSYEMGEFAEFRSQKAIESNTSFQGNFNFSGGLALDLGFNFNRAWDAYVGLRNIAYLKEYYGNTYPLGMKSILYLQTEKMGFFYQFENLSENGSRSLGQIGFNLKLDQVLEKQKKKKNKRKRKKAKRPKGR